MPTLKVFMEMPLIRLSIMRQKYLQVSISVMMETEILQL